MTAPSAEAEKDIRDLARGALVNFVGRLARVSRSLFLWAITFLCGLEVQFLYSLVWSVVTILSRVARFGLHRGVVSFVVSARRAEDPGRAERVLLAALGIGLLGSGATVVACLLGADALAAIYAKPIAGAVRIMAWSLPFLTMAGVFLVATQALRIMRFDVYVTSVAGPLILLVGGVIVGLARLGLTGVAWVQVAMAVGSFGLAAHYGGRHFPLRRCLGRIGEGAPWRELARFSLPVMVTDVLYGLLGQLDVLMLGWLAGPEEVELAGVYVLAQGLATVMQKAPQSFDPMFTSVAGELFTQRRHEELGHRFVVISRWILTINLPIFAGLLVVGDPLLHAMETSSRAQVFADGLQILFLLCSSFMVQSIFAMFEPLLVMSGRPGLNLMNSGLWLGLNVGLDLLFVRWLGLVGIALGSLVAAALVNGLRVAQVYLLHDIFPFRPSQLKPVAAVAAATGTAWLARVGGPGGALWGIAVPLIAFAAAYVVLLAVLGLEPEDRALLSRIARRYRRRQRRAPDGERQPDRNA